MKLSTFDMVLIPILSVIGIIIKPIIAPVINIITDFALVPGGSIAGGFNIMWILLGTLLVKHKHTAKFMCFIQAFISLIIGTMSFQGILIFVTYLIPGIIIDFIFNHVKTRNKLNKMIISGAIGNLGGSMATNFLFFNLDLIPVSIFFIFAIIFGGLGGYGGYYICKYVYENMIVRGSLNE